MNCLPLLSQMWNLLHANLNEFICHNSTWNNRKSSEMQFYEMIRMIIRIIANDNHYFWIQRA